MKRFFAVVLAMMMLCSACGALAEAETETAAEPVEENSLPFVTVGEALDAGGADCLSGGYNEYWIVAMKLEEEYIRLVAYMDEEAIQKRDAIAEAEDIAAAFDDFNAYVAGLPIAYCEVITAAPKDQEELDAAVGKTIHELEEAGYDYNASGTFGEDSEVSFTMASGLFSYEFVINESFEVYQEHEENGSYDDLTVKSAKLAGLSPYVLELRFHADGTVEAEEDPMADFTMVLQAVSDAIAAAQENGEEVDPEQLIAALVEAMPEHEEEIRMIVAMFLGADGNGSPETGAPDADGGETSEVVVIPGEVPGETEAVNPQEDAPAEEEAADPQAEAPAEGEKQD